LVVGIGFGLTWKETTFGYRILSAHIWKKEVFGYGNRSPSWKEEVFGYGVSSSHTWKEDVSI
jgi:hypothetical protein